MQDQLFSRKRLTKKYAASLLQRDAHITLGVKDLWG